MRQRRLVPFVDTHTAGEPTRIILGGFPRPLGATMEERRQWLTAHADGLRRFVLREPRGHRDMFGAVLSEPVDATCDAGVFFMESGGYLRMCGHGTIGLVTALVSLGWCSGPDVALDTPAGRVVCRVHGDAGSPEAVSVRNVPSFYIGDVDVEGITVSLAFGGNLFGLVDVAATGLRVDRAEIASLVRTALRLRVHVNELGPWTHPSTGQAMHVDLIEFYEDGDPPHNLVVFGHGQVDRSPCGTGTSAKMAYLHATGRLAVGDRYPYRSVLDTEFVGRIVEETDVGGRQGIVPEITGAAHIVSMGNLVLEENDPLPDGFELAHETNGKLF